MTQLVSLKRFHWTMVCPVDRVERGRVPNKVYTGRLRPEVQHLTLLYTIFGRTGTPFVLFPF